MQRLKEYQLLGAKKTMKGYIARWYSYYSAETCCEDERTCQFCHSENSPCHLYSTELDCTAHCITHGVSWYYTLYEILNERSQQASCIYLVAEITMLIFNFIDTVLMYMDNDIPPIHLAKRNVTSEEHCIPSRNSSLYKDELTAFTAKMLRSCLLQSSQNYW